MIYKDFSVGIYNIELSFNTNLSERVDFNANLLIITGKKTRIACMQRSKIEKKEKGNRRHDDMISIEPIVLEY